MLAHLVSEAELAAVLGHEIGHVTARHAVSRISKAQLANLGVGVGMILSPDLRRHAELANVGLSLLFLQYSRDDERQADDLGLRYTVRAGYDPRPMTGVFTLLERVSRLQEAGRLPEWLASHPNPENRRERISQQIAELEGELAELVGREPYLRRIDGIVFGENPREGFFRENLFVHPDLRFQVAFPAGWAARNMKREVAAISPRRDAAIALALSPEASLADAARAFAGQRGVMAGRLSRREVNGLRGLWGAFEAAVGEARVQGVAAFVEHEGRVYQLLGYAARPRWRSYEPAITSSLASFAPLTDPNVLAVQPNRIQLMELRAAMSVDEFAARHPSVVPLEVVALVNQVEPGERLAAGQLVKRVVRDSAQTSSDSGRTG